MRFVLDENVDARVRDGIVEQGHTAWTVPQAGMAGDADADLSVYAQRLQAVLVTHDREFSMRVKRRVVGQHVYLKCAPRQAHEVLARYLLDAVAVLERHEDLYVSLTLDSMEVTYANQREEW